MEYEIFERDFIVRTLRIIQQYEEYVPVSQQFEVTLLINCLLGLLVLPKERCYVDIPDVPINQLEGWGLCADHIKAGRYHSLNEIIRGMRNSVAHIRFRALGNGSEITDIEFSDRSEFKAVIPVNCLKTFVTKLAQSVRTNNIRL
ncbi:MAG TPA: HEPN family nuclease [Thermodesulfobacteriota bacterium]|nr:HEPN family nuclease [Thermodesulfobacteriota bacterium]